MFSTFTYKQAFKPDSLTFEMAKESGRIYTQALRLYKEGKTIPEINKTMEGYAKTTRKYLIAQSAQAPYQKFITNLKTYFKAVKDFGQNPSKYSGKPNPPHKEKFLFEITFKEEAIIFKPSGIKHKDFKKNGFTHKQGYLYLSRNKPYSPIKIRWSDRLPIPKWVTISYDKYRGWRICFICDRECKELREHNDHSLNILGIDLGTIRTATTFNLAKKETTTYSGKFIMSLVRLRNKADGRIKSKVSKYDNIVKEKEKIELKKELKAIDELFKMNKINEEEKKHKKDKIKERRKNKHLQKSRRNQKLQKAKRKIIRRIDNKINDVLHKYSRIIVNKAIRDGIETIVIGNNSSTHDKTNTGNNNQKNQQNPEQKLKWYIKEKFERDSVSGMTKIIPEPYTSRTCPACDNVKNNSPKGRTYSCQDESKRNCKFIFDRDGVGSINITKKEVSFILGERSETLRDLWVDVVGGLTPPNGVKYTSGLSLNLNKVGITHSLKHKRECVSL